MIPNQKKVNSKQTMYYDCCQLPSQLDKIGESNKSISFNQRPFLPSVSYRNNNKNFTIVSYTFKIIL